MHSDANRGRVLLNRSMKFQFNLFSSAALSMKSEVLFKEGIKDLNDSKLHFRGGLNRNSHRGLKCSRIVEVVRVA